MMERLFGSFPSMLILLTISTRLPKCILAPSMMLGNLPFHIVLLLASVIPWFVQNNAKNKIIMIQIKRTGRLMKIKISY